MALPAALADAAGGVRMLAITVPESATLGTLLRALRAAHPLLGSRLCDDSGALRRHVNVYVDGTDVRATGGAATALSSGCRVDIVPSVAGG